MADCLICFMEISLCSDANLLEIFICSKALQDGTPSFCPILPAVETQTYNLSKICYRLLKHLKSNDYVMNDSFFLVKGDLEFDVLFFMTSFDTDSLFINIPFTETISFSLQNLYRNEKYVSTLSKYSFYNLLKNTSFESCFILYGKFYGQCYGVAMDSILKPTLSNAIMCHFEDIWFENCPTGFNSIVCFKLTEDLLVIHSYYFDQRTRLRNLEVISVNNIKTKYIKFKKLAYSLFQT